MTGLSMATMKGQAIKGDFVSEKESLISLLCSTWGCYLYNILDEKYDGMHLV